MEERLEQEYYEELAKEYEMEKEYEEMCKCGNTDFVY